MHAEDEKYHYTLGWGFYAFLEVEGILSGGDPLRYLDQKGIVVP
jgi:hypothetical protein